MNHIRKTAESIIQVTNESDGETLQEAYNNLIDLKREVNCIKHENKRTFRLIDFQRVLDRFEVTKEFADERDILAMNKLSKTAIQAIDSDYDGFENILSAMRNKIGNYMFRQDWYAIDRYKSISKDPSSFTDRKLFYSLKEKGEMALHENNINELRNIFFRMQDIRIFMNSSDDMFDEANIIRQ